MQKHIFNKYDIRGIIGTELMIEEVEQLTHAIVSFYKKQNPGLTKIAVAMDGRIHSSEIYKKVSQVIVSCGLQVHFLGVCPTPVFVFGLYHLPVQAGIMITGSHHSKEYNGFKLYLDKKSVWGDQIQEIYELYQQKVDETAVLLGKILPTPIVDQYIESLWQKFAHLSQYDFSLIIDCAHGVAGPVIKKLIQKMKWKRVQTMNDIVDGTFPTHEPDPSDDHNMKDLRAAVLKTGNSFGIGFDGDAGRMIAMEECGSLVLGDKLFALFARDILRNKKHASVVCDITCSLLVRDVIEQQGGTTVVSSVGAPLVKDAMEKSGALLGGEMSGYYFFKDRHEGYDDGIYVMCRLLDILVQERKSLHEILMTLPELYSSYEVRIPCLQDQKYDIIKQVSDVVAVQNKWKVSQVDGVRAEIGQGWGLLRACNTQPMMSFRCEAKDKQELLEIKKEFKELLKPHIANDVLKNLL